MHRVSPRLEPGTAKRTDEAVHTGVVGRPGGLSQFIYQCGFVALALCEGSEEVRHDSPPGVSLKRQYASLRKPRHATLALRRSSDNIAESKRWSLARTGRD